jgi:subtilisin family serine protease
MVKNMSSMRDILAGIMQAPGKSSMTSGKKSTGQTRKMVVLKNSHCYHHCLAQLKALGIKPVKKVAGANAVVCHFPAKASLKALSTHSMVKRVEHDAKVKVHRKRALRQVRISAPCASVNAPQIIPWGVKRVGAPNVWRSYQGSGVRIGIVDTGISPHPDLRIRGRFNAIAGTPDTDENGHGTHVSGTASALNNSFGVVGVAPKARLYSVKAFDASGSAFVSDIVEALEWCISHNMQVINMSFGIREGSDTVKEQIERAYRKGIVMVASAGNDGPNTDQIDFPARLPQVIAVAASDIGNKVASFSNRGKGIAVTAPGVDICSTLPGRSYGKMSGTSMAAPHVTGAAALLLSKNRKLSPARVRQVLRSTAKRLPGYSSLAQGAGLVQVNKAIRQV